MKEGYKKIFWGILIATFRVHLGPITILPAFIGWIIVVIGLSQLNRNARGSGFSKAWSIAMILVALNLIVSLSLLIDVIQIENFLPFSFYPLIGMGIELIFFHGVLRASVDHLDTMGLKEPTEKYIQKDRTFTIVMGITMVLLAFSLLINDDITGLIATVIAAVMRIYMLTIIYSLSKEDMD